MARTKKVTVVEYTGQSDIALIPDESYLKNEAYQIMFDMGVTICLVDSWMKYSKENS